MSDPIEIKPIEPFAATLTPPGSKSLTNRALLLGALSEGRSRLSGALFSDDTRVMIEALQRLGFELDIDESARTICVTGSAGRIPNDHVDLSLANAGTAYRFLTAACCLGRGMYHLDGSTRMRQRPVRELVDALQQLDAQVRYSAGDGYPPVQISARGLRGGELTMKPTASSQYISALLLAAPCCDRGLTIHFDGPVTSRPYVEMTVKLMARFGVQPEVDEFLTRIHVPPGRYRARDYRVEPDASSASYFLAAAAIVPGSKCTIEGLGRNSLQGDVAFADVLNDMGADLVFGPDFITVMAPPEGRKLRGIDMDLNRIPDMVQTLAAVALFAEGRSTVRNVGNLRVKETDRLDALRKELTKLGANVNIDGDNLMIEPPPQDMIRSEPIDTYDDHRMAMSFAVIGLRIPGGIVIRNPSCVNKTFPDFFQYLERLWGGERKRGREGEEVTG